MKIVTARNAGFCFGVKRAVDMAFEAADKGDSVYTLGPVIHNPQVIEKLRTAGVKPTDDLEAVKIKTLIIRTHGVPKDVSERLAGKDYAIIDATCPFVKKAQEHVETLKEGGYQVVIIGDRDHPEVKGLMSYAGNDVIVVSKDEAIPALKSRVGVVVQTTQPISALKRVVSEIIGHVKELKVFNTICSSTSQRISETADMAKEADVVIVVGGKNSANTTQLTNLCADLNIPTYHIETSSEIRDEWFEGAQKIGITAGASTPDWIIREVEQRIKDIGG
ncbi:MAG: 4-hydroxy-3-methylbut-2-enyl diphosphate reductase [Nitrospirae bacterium]|nr:4-hydroxy-3-methylbut-2-enyl diphosphate reductase [Nitrospirota bacterium]